MLLFNVFDLTAPPVQAALITGVCAITATTIGATCAAIIGKRIANVKSLQEDLSLAKTDIAFLLSVEQRHCEMHRERGKGTFKVRVRDAVRAGGGTWSGKFTPGRNNHHH